MSKLTDLKYRILIIDDEPSNIQYIAKVLKRNNYIISYAATGEKALEMIKHNHFDLILLDVIMPGMNGFDICRSIKQHQNANESPIIFLTAKSEISDILEGFKLGAADYITRPFNDSELLARIAAQLALKSKRDELKTELKMKEKIIIDNAIYLTRRYDLSKSIINDLKALNEKTGNHYSDIINSVNKKLNTLIEAQEWKEFEVRINEIHEDFQKKIFKRFPNLTPSELKLCTYLRMNMASRDIAEITNRSVGALETARSRLRKKLNLSHTANLVNFLHQF